MAKKRTPTFADVLREESARPTRSVEVNYTPGEFNEDHQLFDLAGIELIRTKTRITPKEAIALIGAGAKAASEGCGCGGWAGCQPEWLNQADAELVVVSGKPRMLKGNCPTWIDVWTNQTSTLVFAHGDISWT